MSDGGAEGLLEVVADAEADALGGGDGGLEGIAVGPALLEQLLDVGHAPRSLLAPAAGTAALALPAGEG